MRKLLPPIGWPIQTIWPVHTRLFFLSSLSKQQKTGLYFRVASIYFDLPRGAQNVCFYTLWLHPCHKKKKIMEPSHYGNILRSGLQPHFLLYTQIKPFSIHAWFRSQLARQTVNQSHFQTTFPTLRIIVGIVWWIKWATTLPSDQQHHAFLEPPNLATNKITKHLGATFGLDGIDGVGIDAIGSFAFRQNKINPKVKS